MALNFLLDLLFPKFCFGCHKIGTYLCLSCRQKIIFTKVPLCPVCERPSPFSFTHPKCNTRFGIDGLIVLGDYSGVLRQMVHFLKYKNVFSLGETLIDLFSTQPSLWFPKFDFLTSVPLHRSRFLERGFNQAEILAKIFAAKRNLICLDKVIARTHATVSQMTIRDLIKRKQNMHGAFIALKKDLVKNKTIGIFDDVATTGATMLEAAKVLKRNGAKIVWGIVLARSLPRFSI